MSSRVAYTRWTVIESRGAIAKGKMINGVTRGVIGSEVRLIEGKYGNTSSSLDYVCSRVYALMYANLHNPARRRAVGALSGLYGRNSEPLKPFKLQPSNAGRSATTPRDFVLSHVCVTGSVGFSFYRERRGDKHARLTRSHSATLF